MKTDKEEDQQRLLRAKKKVKQIQIFYLHLLLYFIVVGLLVWNFFILEEGPYKNNIITLNLSVLVCWTAAIILHAVIVFKGKKLFNKTWEDKKRNEFLKEKAKEESTFWE
jgi:ABC-type transport system involved in cytochrome bd biosynthesis fused ATPase/permease subunit